MTENNNQDLLDRLKEFARTIKGSHKYYEDNEGKPLGYSMSDIPRELGCAEAYKEVYDEFSKLFPEVQEELKF